MRKRMVVFALAAGVAGCAQGPAPVAEEPAWRVVSDGVPEVPETTPPPVESTAEVLPPEVPPPTSQGVVGPCAAADLAGMLESSEYGQQAFGFVTMRNIGDAPCTVDGYPQLTIRGAAGEALAGTVRGTQQPGASTLEIPPQGQAGFTILWTVQPNCRMTPESLEVGAPTNRGSVVMRVNEPSGLNPMHTCDGVFDLSGWERSYD